MPDTGDVHADDARFPYARRAGAFRAATDASTEAGTARRAPAVTGSGTAVTTATPVASLGWRHAWGGRRYTPCTGPAWRHSTRHQLNDEGTRLTPAALVAVSEALLHVLGRILVECLLAGRATEIIVFAVVRAPRGRFGYCNIHPAHRILDPLLRVVVHVVHWVQPPYPLRGGLIRYWPSTVNRRWYSSSVIAPWASLSFSTVTGS